MTVRLHRCLGAVLTLMLIVTPWTARAQTSSSSRPLTATVLSTYVAHNGALALLVLWRGSPGWFSGGSGNSSSGGGSSPAGREVGSFTLTYGGRTFSIDLDYTARVAQVLDQEISLAETNILLVDNVDAPSGGRIVGRHWVDPKLPEVGASGPTLDTDPAVVAIRRAPEAGAFLQCEVPVTLPADPALDEATRTRMTEYIQGFVTQTCRAALQP